MQRRILAAVAAFGLPWASNIAAAIEPAAEGATTTMNFKVVVKETSKGEFASTAIEHVLNAQCSMLALAPSSFSWDGPTAQQEAAAQNSAAQGEALAQQMSGSQDYAAQIEAEANKCGADEACLTALAMKMANDPNFLAQQGQMQAGAQAAQKLQPDLGPVRYQQWNPQSCTGKMQANDTYVTSDPGGEGGDGAYTDTVTVAAAGPVADNSWPGLFIQTDLIDGTTTYKLIAPPPLTLPSNSSMQGAASRQVSLLGGTALPEVLGPYPGVLGKHSAKVKSKDGSIAIEWSPGH
ncbi:MAG TPA: hypothetical protein PLR41_05720 [Alphaproteobacteria bacterium]|nr:hypothetical protein [Alphaproteobacteria bacterium]